MRDLSLLFAVLHVATVFVVE